MPHINFEYQTKRNIPYNLKISTKNGIIDQKREEIEIRPGYHLIIRVVPKVATMNENVEAISFYKKECKLQHETNGLNFLKLYSKDGCEVECAATKAVNICKCLPWFYPNNFITLPICDMFGAKCFDMIMSDDKFYQNCTSQCLDDCNRQVNF